jgi:hypothetical protein
MKSITNNDKKERQQAQLCMPFVFYEAKIQCNKPNNLRLVVVDEALKRISNDFNKWYLT